MKICIVADTFYPDTNGVAVVLKNYVDGLIEKGHEVVIVRGKRNQETKDEIKESNYDQVVVYSVPLPVYDQFRLSVPTTPKVAMVLEKEKFDLVYLANEWLLGITILNMAKLKGLPIVTAYHSNISGFTPKIGRKVTEKALNGYFSWFHNQADSVIVPSVESKEYLTEVNVKKPISILENGVDTKMFSPSKRSKELRKEWGVDDGTPVILYVGRISPEKNMELYFKTIDSLKDKGIYIYYSF